MSSVQFDDENEISSNHSSGQNFSTTVIDNEPKGIIKFVLKIGIVSTEKQARTFLIFFVVICFIVTFFLFFFTGPSITKSSFKTLEQMREMQAIIHH
jgi:hypothetical protein